MVIAAGGCDNVEWGGVELAVLPPPPKAGPAETRLEAGERLPEGPILYHVVRDSARATVIPVAEIVDQQLQRIRPGDDPEGFGSRFIAAFLRQGAELTLFDNGRRAGTLIVDSAAVPGTEACHRVPRGYGHLELSGRGGGAGEFLAMARTQAPQGRMLAGDSLPVEVRMQVVGNIMAERALRARGAQLPNWSTARRQLFPFPVEGTQDLGFTATYLVDDELIVGHDDQGYSLLIVYTPQAQTGYDTAYVAFTSYTASGKAAPRVVDFLDWDRDGSAELLLEVFGTRNRWYEAVGQVDDDWERVFQDRCDDGPAMATQPADSAAPATGTATPGAPARGTTGPRADTARAAARPSQQQAAPEIPDIQPRIQLQGQRPRPDSGTVRL